MACRIRAARPSDLRSLYDLAKLTGGGFTNLPAEKGTLEAKLANSEAGFSREGEAGASPGGGGAREADDAAHAARRVQ